MKEYVDLWSQAGYILERLGKGVLLTTAAEGKTNTMTIGWGTLGIQWGKPIFIAFVRESRYTKELLEKNPEFTVNISYGETAKEILGICGTRSGRDMDKFRELNLNREPGETVSGPGIRELPLTLECKVIYQQDQAPEAICPEAMTRYYKEGDFHTAYYGQVTAAYIIK